jgi:predicted secreted acid phosphatase
VEPYDSTSFNQWVLTGKAPALPESLKLYEKLLSLKVKVVFITGRSEDQRNVTTTNLKHVGYHTWEKLILK